LDAGLLQSGILQAPPANNLDHDSAFALALLVLALPDAS